MPEGRRIAIVEDDALIAEYLRDICEDLQAEVVGIAYDADEADLMLRRCRPDFVLMDVRLGGVRDGVDVAIDFHAVYPSAKVVFITGSNEPPTIERIHADHPHRILIKPISNSDLELALT